jgi:hypothetical protein
MSLYNHVEIWKDRPEMWPKGIYCNGHIMVDAEKMVSEGFFVCKGGYGEGEGTSVYVRVYLYAASCSFSHFLALPSLLFSFRLFSFVISNREFRFYSHCHTPTSSSFLFIIFSMIFSG